MKTPPFIAMQLVAFDCLINALDGKEHIFVSEFSWIWILVSFGWFSYSFLFLFNTD